MARLSDEIEDMVLNKPTSHSSHKQNSTNSTSTLSNTANSNYAPTLPNNLPRPTTNTITAYQLFVLPSTGTLLVLVNKKRSANIDHSQKPQELPNMVILTPNIADRRHHKPKTNMLSNQQNVAANSLSEHDNERHRSTHACEILSKKTMRRL